MMLIHLEESDLAEPKVIREIIVLHRPISKLCCVNTLSAPYC